MYWTNSLEPNNVTIFKAGMDGMNKTPLVSGSLRGYGIQIDLETRRLYWADETNRRIQSSNLDGTDVVTIQQLSGGPFGLALADQRLYWGYRNSNTVQSSGIQPGAEVRVEYTGTYLTRYFAAPNWNPPKNRTNHCEQVDCSGVCVLTPHSYRCIAS